MDATASMTDGADDSTGASPPTPADPSPGVGSQTLGAIIQVNTRGEVGGPLQTDLVVTVEDTTDMAIADATVTVLFDGRTRTLEPDLDTPGTYRAVESGYAQVYEFDIERGSDTLTDVVLVGPSVHEIELDASPVTVDQPATVTWIPNSEPEVMVNVLVFGVETNTTYTGGPVLDDGEYLLPAEAFPEQDDYWVRIERFTRRDLDGPASIGSVRLMLDRPTQALP